MVSAARSAERRSLAENSRQGVAAVSGNSHRASSCSKPRTALGKRPRLRPESVRSRNLYGYVLNDPVNLTDPSGLYTFGIGITTGAVGGAAGVTTTTQIVVDTSGNVGIATTTCAGGITDPGEVESGVVGSVGNAPTICDLQGTSLETGVAIGTGLQLGGSTTLGTDSGGNPTTTLNLSAVGNLGISPVDMAGLGCRTTVVPLF